MQDANVNNSKLLKLLPQKIKGVYEHFINRPIAEVLVNVLHGDTGLHCGECNIIVMPQKGLNTAYFMKWDMQ